MSEGMISFVMALEANASTDMGKERLLQAAFFVS
tara:strand:- start:478 stop:579 length:102 start_codon:yes stop_codon:yes gene_type:complete